MNKTKSCRKRIEPQKKKRSNILVKIFCVLIQTLEKTNEFLTTQ